MDVVRVAVSGALGRMGSTTCAAVGADAELRLVAAVDPGFAHGPSELASVASSCFALLGDEGRFTSLDDALTAGGIDVVVDFTVPAAVLDNVLTCVRHRMPAVIGTTGLSASDLAQIDKACSENGTPVLVAPNFAVGAVLMMEFACQAAEHFKACEIIEMHHDRKLDAPSGTSRLTRLRIEESWRKIGQNKEVPIHSVRLPGLVAHQAVIFGGTGETLTIRHDSLSRESFMPGVILAIKRISAFQGLVVGLENVL
ncbi:MAG: 4-hydroxy-tetrahydrodipicolinate reductase [Actinobacteria bacterium]|nr:4-hydroxy-tetrahydrodipicolinate reductase [Actinomycetota bacterium]